MIIEKARAESLIDDLDTVEEHDADFINSLLLCLAVSP